MDLFDTALLDSAGGFAPSLVRIVSVYVTVVVVAVAVWFRRGDRLRLHLATVSTLLALGSLLVVNRVAVEAKWWFFEPTGPAVAGTPADFWITWACLWGALASLLVPTKGSVATLGLLPVGFAALDLAVMPLFEPAVTLGSSWLAGEAVALAVVLGPTLVLTHLTLHGRHLVARALVLALGFGLVMFYVLPSLLFEVSGGDWATLRGRSLTEWIVVAVLCSPFGVTALAALREFVDRGSGTPVPHDPPTRLVTSGPYAYVRNPMQMSMTVLLICFGALAGSWSIAAASAGAFTFSVGYAQLVESAALADRYGAQWLTYRTQVPLFIPRWKPYLPQAAVVWVGAGCVQCAETGDYLMKLSPASMVRRPAESRPVVPTRITFEAEDGSVSSGLVAISRVLERVNLAWALAGWLLRLPVPQPRFSSSPTPRAPDLASSRRILASVLLLVHQGESGHLEEAIDLFPYLRASQAQPSRWLKLCLTSSFVEALGSSCDSPPTPRRRCAIGAQNRHDNRYQHQRAYFRIAPSNRDLVS